MGKRKKQTKKQRRVSNLYIYSSQIQPLYSNRMEKPGVVDFKVGQLAELKTFLTGYRGAWFRSKILNIIPEENKIKLDYYDFDQEEPSWEQIYEAPPHGRKTKQIKELMLRPRYPPMYHKSEMPPAKSISEVCVVINGRWKVGDRVDWYYESVFWSARVIKVLSDVKVQIELPMPPAGEGNEYEACCKDLRPYLNWSEREGWTLPTVGGRTSGSAQLIFPSKQGTGLEVENATGSPLNVSSSTCISAEGDSERQSKDVKMDNNFTEGDMKKQSSDHVDTAICEEKVQSEDVKMDDVFAEGDTQKQSSYPVDTVICEENVQSKDVEVGVEFAVRDTKKQSSDPVEAVIYQEKEPSKDVKMDDEFALVDIKKQSSDPVHTVMEEKVQCEDVKMNDDDVVGSSDNTSSLRVEESKAAVDECDIDRSTNLNIMHEYTLEAAVTDLEKLANKIKSDPVHTVMEEKVQCEDLKMNDDDVVGSLDDTSSLRVEVSRAAVDECDIDRRTNLNIMHEYTLEAAVTDLEELANKIKWMKAILNNNGNQSTTNDSPSWKFELFPSH